MLAFPLLIWVKLIFSGIRQHESIWSAHIFGFAYLFVFDNLLFALIRYDDGTFNWFYWSLERLGEAVFVVLKFLDLFPV